LALADGEAAAGTPEAVAGATNQTPFEPWPLVSPAAESPAK
jgi:hypothetical protein